MASPSPSPKRASVTSTSPPPKTVQQALDELLDSSDGDAAILRPRGKLASRMQVRGNVEQESASESETDIDSQNEKKDNAKPTTTTTAVSQSEDDDEDEVITKRPRKLQPRRQRSASLETTTQEAPPTPGLFVSPAKSTTAPDSPGLFVSPSKPPQSSAATRASAGDITESDEDLPNSTSLAKNPRFQAMLAKKRKEAKAKEAEEARKRAARLAAQNAADDDMSDDEDDDNITDDEGGRKLTQDGARPIRKASKKALEEMHRETQRLTRSLQLTHEAKVKKKMTKASLFERFNFKPEGVVAAPTTSTAAPAVAKLPDSSRAPTPSSPHKTDLDDGIDKDTPPSSPPVAAEGKEAHSEVAPESESLPLLEQDSDGELPTLEEALAQKKRLDKGKGKAIDAPTVIELQKKPKGISKSKRNLRVKLAVNPATITAPTFGDSDSDDLEILPTRPKTKIDAIFDRRPTTQAQESRSLHHLRKLAQLDDPEKQPTGPSRKNAKQAQAQPSMSAGALQASLLQRARAQAKLERDRHLELLRSKGIHVQTAEEREREMADVEDMVTRARREAEEIMAREREDAKKDRKARKDAGEVDILGWDDSDESGDEDYQGDDGEEVVEEKEVELSGSEDEDGVEDEDEDMNIGEDDDEDEEADAEPAGILFDDLAESAEESETEDVPEKLAASDDEHDSDEDMVVSSRQVRRKPANKHVTILSDDDDEDEEDDQPKRLVEATPKPKTRYPKSPSAPNTKSPKVPTSVLRSATKTFIPGLSTTGPAGLGLTQIFAGTMDDSQMGSAPPGSGSPSQPMPTFDVEAFPDSNFSQTAQETSSANDMILDSQPVPDTQQEAETQAVQIRFSQSQVHGFDSFLQENLDPLDPTQTSDLIEPTQDAGFQNYSPLRQRFVELPRQAPVSTVDTVKLDVSQQRQQDEEVEVEVNMSPLVKRTGKLRRKADVVAAAVAPAVTSPDVEEEQDEQDEDDVMMEGIEEDGGEAGSSAATAFDFLKLASLKEKKIKAKKEAFDKKKSKAREMVEDQAAESEDEYAGLGGVDGEGDSDDDDESVKEMIDDETKNNEVDERKLAAFHADQDRATDSKQVEKLFHDITTGMLRRKRGTGDWDDLDDEDDGGEAKRRMKRRQFAKMQRALFADERISKVAENPRNQAFLRTIEDHGSDDDMDFIFAPPPVAPGLESQDSQSQLPAAGDSKNDTTIIPNSQPAAASTSVNPRRTNRDSRKNPPTNISDIRESLSNLLSDEPMLMLNHSSSVIPATEAGSDSEDDGGDAGDYNDDNDDVTEQATRIPQPISSNKENRNPRRTTRAAQRGPVVDRISLKRKASSSISNSGNNNNRLAFAAPPPSANCATGGGGGGGFKVPALLRRATTNSTLITSSSSTTSISSSTINNNNNKTGNPNNSSFSDDSKVKKTTASRRSGVNYFARETERRALVAENERRREAKKWKGAEGRGKVVGGLFGVGKFE